MHHDTALADSRRGHIIPKKERSVIDATGGSATYGEVMPEGIQAVVDKLALTSDDVFMGALGIHCDLDHSYFGFISQITPMVIQT